LPSLGEAGADFAASGACGWRLGTILDGGWRLGTILDGGEGRRCIPDGNGTILDSGHSRHIILDGKRSTGEPAVGAILQLLDEGGAGHGSRRCLRGPIGQLLKGGSRPTHDVGLPGQHQLQ